MTRHFFRFAMIDGSTVELMTADTAKADKIIDFTWATGGPIYFSPWMNPMVEDPYGDKVPDTEGQARVNLRHVTAIEHRKREP